MAQVGTPISAPRAEPSQSDATGGGDEPPAAANNKRPRAPVVQNATKLQLKALLKASSKNVVHDVSVSLSFTMEGLTYACVLPVTRSQEDSSAAFPELHSLIDAHPRNASFKALLKTVVRALNKRPRVLRL